MHENATTITITIVVILSLVLSCFASLKELEGEERLVSESELEEDGGEGSLARDSSSDDTRKKLSVYYSTLCGDSKRFIRNQLYPFMIRQGGSTYFRLTLIPFGKAEMRRRVSGETTFSCQHGEDECQGNKMHACALKYIPSQDRQLEFISCSMSSSYPPHSLHDCSRELGLDSSLVANIKTCSSTAEGNELQEANGLLTDDGLSVKLFFVPTVTFNNQFNEDKMWASLTNLKSVACDEIRNSNVVLLTKYRDSTNKHNWHTFC